MANMTEAEKAAALNAKIEKVKDDLAAAKDENDAEKIKKAKETLEKLYKIAGITESYTDARPQIFPTAPLLTEARLFLCAKRIQLLIIPELSNLYSGTEPGIKPITGAEFVSEMSLPRSKSRLLTLRACLPIRGLRKRSDVAAFYRGAGNPAPCGNPAACI